MRTYQWLMTGLLSLLLVGALEGLGAAQAGLTPAQAQQMLQKYRWLLDSPARDSLSGDARSFFHMLEQIAQGKKLTPLDARVNNPATDTPPIFTQSEPTIAFNPNTGTICSAWNDSGQFFATGSFNGYGRSTNGGLSFTDLGVIPPAVADLDGNTEPDSTRNYGDPVNAFRALSSGFLHSSIAFDFDLLRSLIGVYHSADDCETWDTTDVSAGGTFQTVLNGLDLNGFQDKEWMAVDNTGSTYDGNIYLCWTEFFSVGFGFGTRILFTRSSDGGLSWGALQSLSPGADSVQGCSLAVGPNGEVYVAWERYINFATAEIRLARSDNGGASFALNNVLVAPLNRLGDASVSCGRQVLNGDIRINEFPSLAVNQSNGHVYVAYASRTARDKADVFLARSTNLGANWSTVRVNDDRTLRDQFFPVARWANPDPTNFPQGLIKVAFYDRRLDGANYKIDLFAAESINGGVSFLPNVRVTDVSFLPYRTNPNIDPIVRGCYMGDYNDMVAADTDGDDRHDSFYIVWGDNREITTLPTRRRTPDPNIYFDEQPLIASCLLDFAPEPALLPPSLDFGAVRVRGTSQLAIHLTNIGGRDCLVLRATSSNAAFRIIGVETFSPLSNPLRLPQGLAPGQSLALIIEARPTRINFLHTGSIAVTTNDPVMPIARFGAQVWGFNPAVLRALALKPLGSAWELRVPGESIAGVGLEIYDLQGRRLVERTANGAHLRFDGLDAQGRRLANGLYLYVMTVRGQDDWVWRSRVQKLVFRR